MDGRCGPTKMRAVPAASSAAACKYPAEPGQAEMDSCGSLDLKCDKRFDGTHKARVPNNAASVTEGVNVLSRVCLQSALPFRTHRANL